MNCGAALSAPLQQNQSCPDQSCHDRCEVVPSLGLYQCSGSCGGVCGTYCRSSWLEPLARKNDNPPRDDEIHLWISHLRRAPCPVPSSGGTWYFPVIQAQRQWWKAIAVRAINVGVMARDGRRWYYEQSCTIWKRGGRRSNFVSRGPRQDKIGTGLQSHRSLFYTKERAKSEENEILHH